MRQMALIRRHKIQVNPRSTLPQCLMNNFFDSHRGATRNDPHPPPHRHPDPGQTRQRAGLHVSTRRSIMDEGKVCALLYVVTCRSITHQTLCGPYGVLLQPTWGPRWAQCGTGPRSSIPTIYPGSAPCGGPPVCHSSCVPVGMPLCCSGHKLTPPRTPTSFPSHCVSPHEAHIPSSMRTCAGVLARLGVTGATLRSTMCNINSAPPPISAPATSTTRLRQSVITDHLSPPSQFLPLSPPVCKSPATGLPNPSHLPPPRDNANPPFPLPPKVHKKHKPHYARHPPPPLHTLCHCSARSQHKC